MRFALRLAMPVLLMLVASGCASQTLVALVPDPDGRVGRAAVNNPAGGVTISAPYHATTVETKDKPPSSPTAIDREKLVQRFSDAISAVPPKPLYFRFYFRHETTPTQESLERLPSIVAAIRQRKSGYISVIGHADTLGVKPYNIDVTMRRALAVRDLLVEQGIPVVTVYPSWVGEDLLLVPTADEVWEPRNRAVEVVVR